MLERLSRRRTTGWGLIMRDAGEAMQLQTSISVPVAALEGRDCVFPRVISRPNLAGVYEGKAP